MLIRDEIGGEAATIAAVVTAAMKLLPQASGTEAAIVDRLRESHALTLSLVAEDAGEVTPHGRPPCPGAHGRRRARPPG